MRDVMRDGKSGAQRQQSEQRHEAANRAIGIAILAFSLQVMAHNALKRQVAETGDKTDGGENDAALQKPAGWGTNFHTSGCNCFSGSAAIGASRPTIFWHAAVSSWSELEIFNPHPTFPRRSSQLRQ
jgi:hypothetical protein